MGLGGFVRQFSGLECDVDLLPRRSGMITALDYTLVYSLAVDDLSALSQNKSSKENEFLRGTFS